MAFSSSTISDVENGLKRVTRDVLSEYARFCSGDREQEDQLDRLYWAMIEAHMRQETRRRNVEQTLERRQALLRDLRVVMQKIAGEIRGFSQISFTTYEQLDERIVQRLSEENEHMLARLEEAGLPKDWRESLKADFES
jgi:16S rRNA C1402 N4-methylase RsmH